MHGDDGVPHVDTVHADDILKRGRIRLDLMNWNGNKYRKLPYSLERMKNPRPPGIPVPAVW